MDGKSDRCILGHANQERIKALERLIESAPRLVALEQRVDKVEAGVLEIRDKLLLRPPWFVVFVLTSLIGLCSTLLTILLKK